MYIWLICLFFSFIVVLYNLFRDRDHSRGGSGKYKEKVRPHSQLHTAEEKHLRERKSNRDNSHSKGGEQRAWVKDSHNRYIIKYEIM